MYCSVLAAVKDVQNWAVVRIVLKKQISFTHYCIKGNSLIAIPVCKEVIGQMWGIERIQQGLNAESER